MKSKNLIVGSLIVALIGVAIWWALQPKPVSIVKSAADLVSVSGGVEAPKVASAPIALGVATPDDQRAQPSEPASPTPAHGAPQAELKSVLEDGADLILAGDNVTFAEKYMPPLLLIMVSAQDWAELIQQDQKDKVNPRERQFAEEAAQAYRSLESQTPEMNAAGDEATYRLTPLPNPRDPRSADAPPTDPVIFKKMAGKWYLETWPLPF